MGYMLFEMEDKIMGKLPKISFKEEDRKKLYDQTALEVARNLINTKAYHTNGVSRHQLRRHFNEVKRLHRKANEKNWNMIIPEVKLLKAKIAYAVERSKVNSSFDKEYYDNFNNFINICVDQVNSIDELAIFTSFFEAVYGYFYSLGGAKKE